MSSVPTPASAPGRAGFSSPIWASRSACAVVLSVAVHAAAAVGVAAFLSSSAPSWGPADRPTVMPVDVAAAETTFEVLYGVKPAVATTTAPDPVQPRALISKRVGARVTPAVAMAASDLGTPVEAAVAAAPAVFALSGGTVAAQRSSPSRANGAGLAANVDASSSAEAGGGVALSEAEVSVPARLLSSTPPAYSPDARRAEIETDLPLEIEVGVDGRVRASRVLSRAGYGLDEAALRAVAGYRFSPALRDGRPVPVRLRWTVQFRLQ